MVGDVVQVGAVGMVVGSVVVAEAGNPVSVVVAEVGTRVSAEVAEAGTQVSVVVVAEAAEAISEGAMAKATSEEVGEVVAEALTVVVAGGAVGVVVLENREGTPSFLSFLTVILSESQCIR